MHLVFKRDYEPGLPSAINLASSVAGCSCERKTPSAARIRAHADRNLTSALRMYFFGQFVFDFSCLFFGEPYRWSAAFQPCRGSAIPVPNHPVRGSFPYKIPRRIRGVASHFFHGDHPPLGWRCPAAGYSGVRAMRQGRCQPTLNAVFVMLACLAYRRQQLPIRSGNFGTSPLSWQFFIISEIVNPRCSRSIGQQP